MSQLTNICTAYDANPGQNKRYLEFCCKCIRRAMEQDACNFEEIQEAIA